MCRSRRSTLASQPNSVRRRATATTSSSSNTNTSTSTSTYPSSSSPAVRRQGGHSLSESTTYTTPISNSTASSSTTTTTTSSSISARQLSLSISENPTLYPFNDIAAATNNFLARRLPSSSSSAWRCTLRGKDVVIFQRSYRGDPANLPSRLSVLCKSHHASLVKLLGASVAPRGGAEHIYLVYRYVAGASLEECLRNPRNPNFTPLSKWISRMQIAADLADGLSYIHLHCNTIHSRIKSSSVIVTEPDFKAKICHFGAAELADEIPAPAVLGKNDDNDDDDDDDDDDGVAEDESIEMEKKSSTSTSALIRRSKSDRGRFEGTRGYIAPEVIGGKKISQKSDVFALGVVILELISGREPVKYRLKKETKEYERISLIDTARNALGSAEEEEEEDDRASEGRLGSGGGWTSGYGTHFQWRRRRS